jgi:hypothetical protein
MQRRCQLSERLHSAKEGCYANLEVMVDPTQADHAVLAAQAQIKSDAA